MVKNEQPQQEQPPNEKGRIEYSLRPFLILIRRRPTFPHSCPCSIIGPARLNFRVRDGNGCDPRGMITRKLETRVPIPSSSRARIASATTETVRPLSGPTLGCHLQVRLSIERYCGRIGVFI